MVSMPCVDKCHQSCCSSLETIIYTYKDINAKTHKSQNRNRKYDIDYINTKYVIRLAVVILIIQWPFKRFHFRYRDLKVLNEVAFLTCNGREFQMAAPEYMNDLRKSSQLYFGVYSWLQLVIYYTSEVYKTQFVF